MSVNCHPDLGVSQNFLKDPRLVASLIEKTSLNSQDLVVEIGPGKGIITTQLARLCRKVVAIEMDSILSEELRRKYTQLHNLVIHNCDFLSHPLPREPYKVFSNIPFNITSAIVNRLTNTLNPPDDAYLVLQKEAAAMYLGKPAESLRSILLQPWFEVKVKHHFRRSDFFPVPHVEPVLLQICKRSPPWIAGQERQLFRDFVTYCYTAWNSTLKDTLRRIFSTQQLKHIRRNIGIESQDIPSSLNIEQWIDLFDCYKTYGSNAALMEISGSEARLACQQKKLGKVHRTRV